MGVIVRGVNGNTVTQYSMAGTACALAARGPPQPHDELPRAAAGLLASLALAHHSSAAFDTALTHLDTLSNGMTPVLLTQMRRLCPRNSNFLPFGFVDQYPKHE